MVDGSITYIIEDARLPLRFAPLYMNKVIEEILTDVSVRDAQSAAAMTARVMNAGSPWAGAE